MKGGLPKTTKEQRQLIIEREAGGEFMSQLAIEYGLTKKYVSHLVNNSKRGIR
jgi:hypothetical protein